MIRATSLTLCVLLAAIGMANARVQRPDNTMETLLRTAQDAVVGKPGDSDMDVLFEAMKKTGLSDPSVLSNIIKGQLGDHFGDHEQLESMIGTFMDVMHNPDDTKVLHMIGEMMTANNPKMQSIMKKINMNEIMPMLHQDDIRQLLVFLGEKLDGAMGHEGISLKRLAHDLAAHIDDFTNYKGEVYMHLMETLEKFRAENSSNELLQHSNYNRLVDSLNGLTVDPMKAFTELSSMVLSMSASFKQLISAFFVNQHVLDFFHYWQGTIHGTMSDVQAKFDNHNHEDEL